MTGFRRLGGRWRGAAAMAALATLVVALFSDAVLRGRVFYERDLHLDWYTQMHAFVRAVAERSWPVWDNTIAFGQPLLADPSAQILYPLTWLNLVLPPWRYYTVFVVVHASFGAIGMYLFARRLQASALGGFLAAALWICSGPFLSMVNTWQHFAAAAWLGWVLLATDAAVESPGISRSATWAAAMAGQVFAGSADVCAMSWLLMAAYLARRIEWANPTSSANRRLLACSALAGVLALGLAGAVWLPVLDVARRSSRWNYPEDVRAAWSLQPATLAGVVVPARVEDLPRVLPPPLAPAPEPREPLLPSLYLGLATVPLVGAALRSRRRGTGYAAAAGAAASLIAVGHNAPVYPLLVRMAPILGVFRYPSKAMIVAAFFWAALAGIGLDVQRQSRGPSRVLLLGWIAGLGALLSTASRLPGPAQGRWRLAAACGLCVALCLLARRANAALSTVWAVAAAVLAIADVFGAHRGMNRTAPEELLAFRPPAVDAATTHDRSRLYVYDYMTPGKSLRYLKRDDPYLMRPPPRGMSIETAQVLSQRLYLFPPVAGRWDLEGSFDLDLRGLYPLPLARLVTLLRRVEGTPAHLRLLRIGAVGRVMTLHTEGLEDLDPTTTLPSLFPEAIHVFSVPHPLPRTYAVGTAREADGEPALAALLAADFDPTREIVLPHPEPGATSTGFSGRSRIADFRPDRVRIEADMGASGYVVLVDSYDPGWRATVDGDPTPVLRANVAFRAVQVPRGLHVVELVYRPPAVLWGLAISGMAVVAALALRVRGH